MEGRERAIDTLSVRSPGPKIQSDSRKEENKKIAEDKKGANYSGQPKDIPCSYNPPVRHNRAESPEEFYFYITLTYLV